MNINEILLLLGGVALFLFGMSLMGDGLKKVAGNKLELILYKLSGTAPRGILLGTGVTAVIQSSSATSVMVVGFVNSGMMKVRQAISVIMGAIIGTSITGWIICLSELGNGSSGALTLLSTETLSSIIAILGIIINMTARKKAVKQVGSILLGFAVLMFGMKTMSSSVSGLKENPDFLKLMTSFNHPLLGILIGMVFTAILQSASASVGILQALSSMKVITFEMAIPIILGIAIGASVPVLLSSVGATTDGKRTSFSYLVIEILRVLVFSLIFYGINAVSPFTFLNKLVDSVSVAALNTIFRAVTVLILAPFIPLIEKIVNRIIPSSPDQERELKAMEKLEERFLAYPPLAVEHSRLAINSMAENTKQNYFTSVRLMQNYSDSEFGKVEKMESIVDKYEDRIGKYLMKLTGLELSEVQTQTVGDYLHAITDLERISDHALNIAESFREMSEKKIVFSNQGKQEISILSKAVGEMITTTIKGFEEDKPEFAFMAEALEEVIDDLCDSIKLNHVERLMKEECTLQNGYVLNDLLTNFERISDQCSNIAVAMIVRKKDLPGHHEYSGNLKKAKSDGIEEYESLYRNRYQLSI